MPAGVDDVVAGAEAVDYGIKGARLAKRLPQTLQPIKRFCTNGKRIEKYCAFAHMELSHNLRQLFTQLKETENDSGDIENGLIPKVQQQTQNYLDTISHKLATLINNDIPGTPTVIIWTKIQRDNLLEELPSLVEDWPDFDNTQEGFEKAAKAAGGQTGKEFTKGSDAYQSTAKSELAYTRSKSLLNSANREHLIGVWFASRCTAMRPYIETNRSIHCYCPLIDLKKLCSMNDIDASNIYEDPIPKEKRHTYYRSLACLPVRLTRFKDGNALAGFLWIDSTKQFAFKGLLQTAENRNEYSALTHLLLATADTIGTALLNEELTIKRIRSTHGNDESEGNSKDP